MVWSDPEIKRLSKEFVTVADEAYSLYPEHPQHLQSAKSRPEHVFFAKYGEQVPASDWNAKGTKQGIYMIGPNSEYLEGKFAASDEPEDIKRRLRRALQRWDELRHQKGYANQPIPPRPWSPPPGVEGELVLRVNLRDLPRGNGDRSGARRHELPESGTWMDFIRWAWNENWVAIAEARSLVPSTSGPETIRPDVLRKIAQEVLVDNVRGQAPEWRPDEVREASATMRWLDPAKGTIEYQGRFRMESGPRGYDARMYGRGTWRHGKFESLDWVVLGTRTGAATFNQRERDPGPAPMGITLSLSRQ